MKKHYFIYALFFVFSLLNSNNLFAQPVEQFQPVGQCMEWSSNEEDRIENDYFLTLVDQTWECSPDGCVHTLCYTFSFEEGVNQGLITLPLRVGVRGTIAMSHLDNILFNGTSMTANFTNVIINDPFFEICSDISDANYQAQPGIERFDITLGTGAANPPATFTVQECIHDCICVPPLLDVELTEFNITENNCAAQLNWTSASESDLAIYEILKSYDGRNFELAATVPAKGNSIVTQNYSYKDKSFRSGAYYKIRARDLNASYEDSQIEYIKNSCINGYIVEQYPNPATNKFTLEVHAPEAGEGLLQIMDLQGSIVQEINQTYSEGGNFFDIDIKHLSPGTYFLKAEFGNGYGKTMRFLKID